MTPLERIKRLASDKLKLDAEQIHVDTALDQLGVDSLGLIEFLFLVEDEFGIRLPQEHDALQTVGDVLALVGARIPASAPAPE